MLFALSLIKYTFVRRFSSRNMNFSFHNIDDATQHAFYEHHREGMQFLLGKNGSENKPPQNQFPIWYNHLSFYNLCINIFTVFQLSQANPQTFSMVSGNLMLLHYHQDIKMNHRFMKSFYGLKYIKPI